MAKLDPRLLPLVETLVAVGADWLAAELIASIERGIEPMEPEEALASTRAKVRQKSYEQVSDFVAFDAVSKALVGDEQIDWAVDYVIQRIESSIEALSASLDNLNELLVNDRAAAGEEPGGIQVVLFDGEDQRNASRESIDKSKAKLTAVRHVMETWRIQQQQGVGQT